MSEEICGHLGDPEYDDIGPGPHGLRALLRASDRAAKWRDDAFDVFRAAPTVENRIAYDMAVKLWARAHNKYLDAISRHIGEP